jgi:hypothetical protein
LTTTISGLACSGVSRSATGRQRGNDRRSRRARATVNSIIDEISDLSARLDDDHIGSDEKHEIIERHMELSKELITAYGAWLLATEPEPDSPPSSWH